MDLQKLYTNLKRLDVEKLAVEILEELDSFISNLNRKQLSDLGVGEDGSLLSPEYANITKDIKSRKSGVGGIIEHITLYDTGKLHKSIFSSITIDSIILDSKDSKVDELTDKYGEFLGLTDDSIKLLQKEFNKLFWPRLKKTIWS